MPGLTRLIATASAAAAATALAVSNNSQSGGHSDASAVEAGNSRAPGSFFSSIDADAPKARLLPSKSLTQPSGLSLASVSVLMRHGARTPLHQVPGSLAYDCQWPTDVCYSLAQADAVQMQLYDPMHPGSQPILLRPHKRYLLGGAQPGALTRFGQADMLRLGRQLRRDYHQLVIDSSRRHKDDYGGWLHCRSTCILRCVQTLRCVLAGLLLDAEPDVPIDSSTAPPTIRVAIRSLIDEDLFPNFRIVPEPQKLNLANSAALLSRLDDYAETRQELTDAFGIPDYNESVGTSTSARHHWFVPLYFARDDLSARLAQGCALPAPVARIYPKLERLCALELLTEEMGPCEVWDEALTYCIGTWVHTLASNVERLASGRGDHHRFELYSSHDSMLLPVLLALGFDPRTDIEWPPFGSAIVFEFYTNDSADNSDKIWCRVLYKNRAVQLPSCQTEFAPLSALSACLLHRARPRDGFADASRMAGRRLNNWYKEHGMVHLDPWPYDDE